MNKDVQQIVRRIRKQGFTVRVGGSGHYRVTSPLGVTITMPVSPSGGCRSLKNVRSNLRRLGAEL